MRMSHAVGRLFPLGLLLALSVASSGETYIASGDGSGHSGDRSGDEGTSFIKMGNFTDHISHWFSNGRSNKWTLSPSYKQHALVALEEISLQTWVDQLQFSSNSNFFLAFLNGPGKKMLITTTEDTEELNVEIHVNNSTSGFGAQTKGVLEPELFHMLNMSSTQAGVFPSNLYLASRSENEHSPAVCVFSFSEGVCSEWLTLYTESLILDSLSQVHSTSDSFSISWSSMPATEFYIVTVADLSTNSTIHNETLNSEIRTVEIFGLGGGTAYNVQLCASNINDTVTCGNKIITTLSTPKRNSSFQYSSQHQVVIQWVTADNMSDIEIDFLNLNSNFSTLCICGTEVYITNVDLNMSYQFNLSAVENSPVMTVDLTTADHQQILTYSIESIYSDEPYAANVTELTVESDNGGYIHIHFGELALEEWVDFIELNSECKLIAIERKSPKGFEIVSGAPGCNITMKFIRTSNSSKDLATIKRASAEEVLSLMSDSEIGIGHIRTPSFLTSSCIGNAAHENCKISMLNFLDNSLADSWITYAEIKLMSSMHLNIKNSDRIDMHWHTLPGANKFHLSIYEDTNLLMLQILKSTKLNYTLFNIEEGYPYFVLLCATHVHGFESCCQKNITIVPGVVKGIKQISATSDTIDLQWEDLNGTITFIVQVFIEEALVVTVVSSTSSVRIKYGLKPSTEYNVTVAASNNGGNGTEGWQIVGTAPSPPTQLFLPYAIGYEAVAFWEDVQGATRYYVELFQSTNANSHSHTVVEPEIKISTLSPNLKYVLTVAAIGHYGNSTVARMEFMTAEFNQTNIYLNERPFTISYEGNAMYLETVLWKHYYLHQPFDVTNWMLIPSVGQYVQIAFDSMSLRRWHEIVQIVSEAGLVLVNHHLGNMTMIASNSGANVTIQTAHMTSSSTFEVSIKTISEDEVLKILNGTTMHVGYFESPVILTSETDTNRIYLNSSISATTISEDLYLEWWQITAEIQLDVALSGVNLSNSTLKISWWDVPGSTMHRLFISVADVSLLKHEFDLEKNYYFHEYYPIHHGRQYHIELCAIHEFGVEACQSRNVTTAPGGPKNIVQTYASQDSLVLIWDEVIGATLYYFDIHENQDLVYRSFTNFTTTGVVPGLEAGKEYNVTLMAENEGGNGSIVWMLAGTVPAVPGDISIVNLTGSSASFKWVDVAGAEKYHAELTQNGTDAFHYVLYHHQIDVTKLNAEMKYILTLTAEGKYGDSTETSLNFKTLKPGHATMYVNVGMTLTYSSDLAYMGETFEDLSCPISFPRNVSQWTLIPKQDKHIHISFEKINLEYWVDFVEIRTLARIVTHFSQNKGVFSLTCMAPGANVTIIMHKVSRSGSFQAKIQSWNITQMIELLKHAEDYFGTFAAPLTVTYGSWTNPTNVSAYVALSQVSNGCLSDWWVVHAEMIIQSSLVILRMKDGIVLMTWSKLPGTSYYHINVYDDHALIQHTYLSGNKCNISFNNIKHDVDSRFQVCFTAHAFNQTSCISKNLTAVPGIIQNVQQSQTTDNSLVMTWDDVFNTNHYYVDMYANRSILLRLTTKLPTGTLLDLKPSTVYNISLMAENEVGRGRKTWYMVGTAPSPVQAIRFAYLSAMVAILSWRSSRGTLSYHYVLYKNGAYDQHGISVEPVLELKDLQPHSRYSLKLWAQGSFANSSRFQTEFHTGELSKATVHPHENTEKLSMLSYPLAHDLAQEWMVVSKSFNLVQVKFSNITIEQWKGSIQVSSRGGLVVWLTGDRELLVSTVEAGSNLNIHVHNEEYRFRFNASVRSVGEMKTSLNESTSEVAYFWNNTYITSGTSINATNEANLLMLNVFSQDSFEEWWSTFAEASALSSFVVSTPTVSGVTVHWNDVNGAISYNTTVYVDGTLYGSYSLKANMSSYVMNITGNGRLVFSVQLCVVNVPLERVCVTKNASSVPGIVHHVIQSETSDTSITLLWDEVLGADEYYVSLTSDGTLPYRTRTELGILRLEGLHPTTEYNVSIFAANKAGNGSVSTFTLGTAPPTPSGLKVLSVSHHGASIIWNAAPGANFYYVTLFQQEQVIAEQVVFNQDIVLRNLGTGGRTFLVVLKAAGAYGNSTPSSVILTAVTHGSSHVYLLENVQKIQYPSVMNTTEDWVLIPGSDGYVFLSFSSIIFREWVDYIAVSAYGGMYVMASGEKNVISMFSSIPGGKVSLEVAQFSSTSGFEVRVKKVSKDTLFGIVNDTGADIGEFLSPIHLTADNFTNSSRLIEAKAAETAVSVYTFSNGSFPEWWSTYAEITMALSFAITDVGMNEIAASWEEIISTTSYSIVAHDQDASTVPLLLPPTKRMSQIKGLKSGTKYQIELCAVNVGTACQILNATTLPGMVTNLRQVIAKADSILISWDEVIGTQLYNISIYVGGEIHSVFTTALPTTGLIQNLLPSTNYTVIITPISGGGEGYPTTFTAQTVPSNPRNFVQTATSASSFIVSWGAVQGAQIYYVNVFGAGFKTTLNTSEPTTGVVSGLLPATRYNVTVAAADNAGTGELSFFSALTVPEAPRNIRQMSTTSSSVTLSWDNVFGAVRYRVTIQSEAGTTLTPFQTTLAATAKVSSLLPARGYIVLVSATNDAGDGEPASFRALTAPGTPTNIRQVSPTNNSVSLVWSDVAGANLYWVTMHDDSNSIISTFATSHARSGVIKNLMSGSEYAIEIVAENDAGNSTVATGFAGTVPSTPEDLALTSLDGSVAIVDWSSTHGALRYGVQLACTYCPVSAFHTTSSPMISISNLDWAGNEYKLGVIAEGRYGNSSVTALHFSTEMISPSLIGITSITATSFVVSWESIQGVVSYTVNTTSIYGSETLSTVDRNALVSKLLPGETYYVRVEAHYPIGMVSSPVYSITTVPGPPVVDFIAVTKYSFILTWEWTVGADRYHYECNAVDGDLAWDGITDELHVEMGNLQSDTEYSCKVRAENDAGHSKFTTGFTTTSSRDCEFSPCQNEGTCIEHTTSFSCICAVGFEGATCNEDVDWCETKVCAGNSTCENSRLEATCFCSAGFKGDPEKLCTAFCNTEAIRYENVTLSFNGTLSGRSAYSNENCNGGRAIASAKCVTSSMMGVYISNFAKASIVAVECEVKVEDITEQVNTSDITTEDVTEAVAILQVVTSDEASITQDDAEDIANFISSVADVAEEAEITIDEDTLINVVTTAENIVSSIVTADSKPPDTAEEGMGNQPGSVVTPEPGITTTTVSPEEIRKKEVEIKQKILKSLPSLAQQVKIPNDTQEVVIETKNLVIQIFERPTRKKAEPAENDTEPEEAEPASESAWFAPVVLDNDNEEVAQQPINITIPGNAFDLAELLAASASSSDGEEKNEPLRITFFLYKDTELFPSEDKVDYVVSADVGKDLTLTNLDPPITVSYTEEHVTQGKEQTSQHFKAIVTEMKCVFWNFDTASWSTEGCCLNNASYPPTCQCDHLTNFALLVSKTEVPADIVLNTVSDIGCSLSVIGLFCTIVVHLIRKEIRQRRNTVILLHVCASLMLSYIVFMVGISRTEDKVTCTAITAVTHYFMLTTWTWMAIYTHDMYRSLVKVFSTDISYYLMKCTLVGYGIPVVIVLANVGLSVGYFDQQYVAPYACNNEEGLPAPSTYVADNMCWLQEYSLYFGFLAPVGLMLIFNLVMYAMLLKSVVWERGKVKSSATKISAKANFMISITLASTTGLSWSVGYFMLFSDDDSYLRLMSWLFCIANTSQGIIVFLLTCIRNETLRNVWWKPFRKRVVVPVNKLAMLSPKRREFSLADFGSEISSSVSKPTAMTTFSKSRSPSKANVSAVSFSETSHM